MFFYLRIHTTICWDVDVSGESPAAPYLHTPHHHRIRKQGHQYTNCDHFHVKKTCRNVSNLKTEGQIM